MKLVIRILGVVLIALGIIWILQGVNILPGSFMTGQIQWAWRGGILVVVGILLQVLARRKPA
jgi:hypothetical protein